MRPTNLRPVSRRRWLRNLLFALPPLVGLDAFGFEPRWLRVRRLRFSDRPAVRFAFFTDLHFKGPRRLLDAVCARVEAEKPEFALFGGDLLEDARHLPELLDTLGRLRTPLFGVPGNHDDWSGIDFDQVESAFARTGGGWLVDRAVDVGAVRITGFRCHAEAELPPRPDRKRNIALIHYPAWADRIPKGFDLILAGHSHGGQVRVPGFGALVTPGGTGRYHWGLYRAAAGPLYVSSGIGTFFLNVRFCCPPELLFIEV